MIGARADIEGMEEPPKSASCGVRPDSRTIVKNTVEMGGATVECVKDESDLATIKTNFLRTDAYPDAVTNISTHKTSDARCASTSSLRTATISDNPTQCIGDESFISKPSPKPINEESQASYERSVLCGNGCGIMSEKPNSHPAKTTPKIVTLDRIAKKLREYVPRDELDQDAITSIISKMNMDACLRQRRRDVLRNCNISIARSWANDDDESYWNDDDIIRGNVLNATYPPSTIHLEALINVVKEEFFDSIIEEVEDSDDRLGYMSILDEDTIKNLEDSLAIQRDSKKRKRRTLRVAVPPVNTGDKSKNNYGIIKLSSAIEGKRDEKKRITRGMARDTNVRDNKNEGLEALLAAMIELETVAGKPIDIVGDTATPNRLRKRRKKKSSHLHHDQTEASKNSAATSGSKVSRNESKLVAHTDKFHEGKQQGARNRGMHQVEVTKIIVGGKEFQNLRKVTKRKRKVDIMVSIHSTFFILIFISPLQVKADSLLEK